MQVQVQMTDAEAEDAWDAVAKDTGAAEAKDAGDAGSGEGM